MVVHDIYPSSKMDPTAIREYGWSFVEDIPTITNDVGRLAPTQARSNLHKELRSRLETEESVIYEPTDHEPVEIRDFAIAESPLTPKVLGFFALQ